MRRVLLPVLLAAALLAAVAHGQGDGGQLNETILAREIEEALKLLRNGTLQAGDAAGALRGLAACSLDEDLSRSLLEAAAAVEEGGEPPRGLAEEIAAAAARGLLRGCSEDTVYRAVLAAASTVSPIGLLPSDEEAARVVEALADALGPGDREGLLRSCGGSIDDAALLVASVAAEPGPRGPLALSCRGCSSLCRAVSLLAEPPVDTPSELLVDVLGEEGLGGLRPWIVWERLVEMYRGGRRVEAAAAAALMEDTWRSYVQAVARLTGAPVNPEADSLRAVYAAGGVDILSPSSTARHVLVNLLAWRAGVRAEQRGAWSWGSPYCGAAAALEEDLLEGNATPYNGLVEMYGAAASLCYAAEAGPAAAARALRLNPFTPLDPWLLSLRGGGGLAGLLWGGRLRDAANAVGDGGGGLATAAAAWAALEWGSSLRLPVDRGYAERLLEALGFHSAMEAAEAALRVEPLARRLFESRGDPAVLGLAARAAGLRPVDKGYIVDYAVVRIVAWVLVKEASVNFPNIVAGSSRSPLDPYYVIFTVPGRQGLILWSLGWVTTPEPPAPSSGATPGEEEAEPGRPRGPGGGLSPGEAAGMLERAADLAAAAGAGEAAEALRAAAAALRRGDYAAAAAALERAQALLRRYQEALARAAAAEGLSLEEAARLLEAALGMSVEADRVTIRAMPGLEEVLARALGGAPGAAGGGGGGGLEEAARAQLGLARRLVESRRHPVVVEIRGLEKLLEERGFVDLSSRLSGLPAPRGPAAALPGGGSPAGTGGGWLLGLLLAAAAAAPAVALARGGGVSAAPSRLLAVVEAVRLRLAARASAPEALMQRAARAVGRVYRERRPWETLREYASGAPARLRGPLVEAVEAFEEAVYGGRGEAVERLRRAVEKLSSRLIRGG